MKSDLEELYKYSLLPVLPDPGDDPRTWFSFIKENQLSFANGIDEHTQMMNGNINWTQSMLLIIKGSFLCPA